MTGGEVRVMDSVRSDDGCSCGAEEGGRHAGDEVLRGGGDVAGCASASRDLEDALLAAMQEEAVLRARLASAEVAFDAARARVARMRNTEVIEERTSSALFFCTNGDGTEKATIAAHRTDPEWILDSGASQHVPGDFSEFESYDELTPLKVTRYVLLTGHRSLLRALGQFNVHLILNYL